MIIVTIFLIWGKNKSVSIVAKLCHFGSSCHLSISRHSLRQPLASSRRTPGRIEFYAGSKKKIYLCKPTCLIIFKEACMPTAIHSHLFPS